MNCLLEDQLPPAITRKMFRRETLKDPVMQLLVGDISSGECSSALHWFKGIFNGLMVVDQIVMRGLQAKVIHLAHEEHQGSDMLVHGHGRHS